MSFPSFQKTTAALLAAGAVALAAFSCNPKTAAPAPAPFPPEIQAKVGFDLSKIDEKGLRGPASGKAAVDYEFCIPSRQTNWEEVQKLDPTLKMNPGAGRIGCAKDWWCVLGSTSGPDWRNRLVNIAKLDYVKEIQETVWE